MYTWEQYKRAALEYAKLRPLLVPTTFSPAPNVVSPHSYPAGVIGVEYLDYGSEFTLIELMGAPSGEQGWARLSAGLYLTPAPSTTTPIRVVWQKAHEADEVQETFPTIPDVDRPLVADLATALQLDAEADEIATGPLTYSFGQSEVDRSKALADLRSRAAALRERVHQKLGGPLAVWS
jgi:hypothetical protein